MRIGWAAPLPGGFSPGGSAPRIVAVLANAAAMDAFAASPDGRA
jgi:hypothetical protein